MFSSSSCKQTEVLQLLMHMKKTPTPDITSQLSVLAIAKNF